MFRKKLASIEINNNRIYIAPVLSFLDSVSSQHKTMDISRYHQLRFVVGELLKARIDNSYPGTSGTLFVDLFLTDLYFEVSIRDKGVPGWHDFSYDENAVVSDRNNFRNFIVDMCVDEVGIEKLGADGQRVFVRKSIVNPIEFKAPEPYPETEALDTNITIRPVVTEDDIIEAIRCIYSEYGYSYSYECLYYVDSFMRMIKSGEIMSFLAVNDHNQTAGHFALAFSDMYKNMPEISTVVIRKEFRGLGLFAKFMTYSESLAKEKGFRALMGQPVAFHPMSQKAFLRAGYTPTSLLMAYLGSQIESEYNKNGERLSLCVGVKLVDKTAVSTIYPPEEISGFVTKIFDNIGLGYDLHESVDYNDITKISVDTNKPLNMTRITVSSIGEDINEVIGSAINSAVKHKSEMIEMIIPLNLPNCEKAYSIAKSEGFAFSGIIPAGETYDYIVMQQFIDKKQCYEKLVMVGEFEDLKTQVVSLNN